MKKIITTLFLTIGVLSINAQNILNGDFSQYSGVSINTSFNDWTGTGTLVTQNDNTSAGLLSKVQDFTIPPTCIVFDPMNPGICITYSPPMTQYIPLSQTLEQVVNIIELPESVKGVFAYTGTADVNAGIVVKAFFDGKVYYDTLLIDQISTSITPFEIKLTKSRACLTDECGQSKVVVKLLSCVKCPSQLTPSASTALAVDNIALSYTVTSSNDVTYENVVFPSPAIYEINVPQSFVGYNYSITNSLGSIIQEGKLTSRKIDISDLIAGVYVISTNNIIHKFVKE